MTVFCFHCTKKLGDGFRDADRPRFCSARCETAFREEMNSPR